MILQRLREATRPDHERLEKNIDLLGRPWSMEFYESLLRKFYGMYAVVEPPTRKYHEWQEIGVDMTQRAKLPALIQDLQALGLSQQEIESLPHYSGDAQVTSFAGALGSAYVMEGSTLGGQIISRHLTKELGLQKETGLAFFGSYGEDVGPMWREFTSGLNAYQAPETEKEEVIASAVATFRAFDRWFSDIL